MMNMKSVEDKKKLLNSDQVIQQSFGGTFKKLYLFNYLINKGCMWILLRLHQIS